MKTQRTLSKAVLILALTALASVGVAGTYSGGTGDPNDPYQIATAQDLIDLGNEPNDYDKHFIMTADIDLSGRTFERAVIAWNTSNDRYFHGTKFAGAFDGNGYCIRNLSIYSEEGYLGGYLGLFGNLSANAVIERIGLKNTSIEGAGEYIGGIAGDNGGLISQCYCTGDVRSSSGRRTGGLLGSNTGTVWGSFSIGEVSGSWTVGGLVGLNGGEISNAYSTCFVTSRDLEVGGLIGFNLGSVNNCYSIDKRLIGSSTVNTPIVYNSFWDVETSGNTWSAGGIGLTTTEMQNLNTYLEAGWDFVGETENGDEAIWSMEQGHYPVINNISLPEMPIRGELSIAFTSDRVHETAGTVTAVIGRSGKLTRDIEVALTISDSRVLYAPESVLIKEGDSSAAVTIEVINDGSDLDNLVSATASAIFYIPATTTILVVSDDTDDYRTLGGYLSGSIAVGEYSVIDNLIVGLDRELIIEPNVTLNFLPNTGIQNYGNLHAKGLGDEPIIFTQSGACETDCWDGLILNNDAVLRFCDVSQAEIGIHATDSNATIENCYIHNCKTYGIFWDSETRTRFGLVHQTVIENNGRSGLYSNAPIRSTDGGIISNCVIQGNSNWGIHLYAKSSGLDSRISTPMITNCDIRENGYGGIYLHAGSSIGSGEVYNLTSSTVNPDIVGCYIYGNFGPGISCWSKGAFSEGRPFSIHRRAYTSPSLDRCLVFNNDESGFRIAASHINSYAFPIISHSCFYNNGDHEFTVEGEDTRVDLSNSIVSTDLDSFFDIKREASVVASYCLFDGLGTAPEGEGNLQGDPQWVDPENGDFRLRVTSPAVDAGQCPAEGDCDYNGLAPDLGALEIDLKPPHSILE